MVVRDTGIGISEEHLPKMFKKFSRGENASRMRPDGSGLGLYISNNIAMKHGAEIKVVSKVGAGTTFSFTVPKEEKDLVSKNVSVKDFFESF